MVGNENFSLNLQNDENEQFNLEMQNEDAERFTVDFGEVINIGGGGTSDFNELENRPKYNDQEMTGETNIPVIPTKVSELDNDSEYQTGNQVESSISSAIAGKQDTLTAGTNISIADNTISATDTTYSNFTGTDGQTAGVAGLVPAPATTDTNKFLKSDGTWDTAGGGSSVNVVQTTGTSTTDVMSQDATTEMIYTPKQTSQYDNWGAVYIGNKDSNNNVYADPASSGTNSYFYGLPYHTSSVPVTPQNRCVCIMGSSSGIEGVSIGLASSTARGGVVIGNSAHGYSNYSVAIGHTTEVSGANYGVALGAYSKPTRSGEVNIGTGNNTYGYNSTKYRVIGGVHDGQDANDAATVGQINATIDAINTALNTNIPHVGA